MAPTSDGDAFVPPPPTIESLMHVLRRITASSVTRRVLAGIITLIGVSIAVFLMLRAIPGDQIEAQYGLETSTLSPDQIEQLKAYYGMDQPLIVQYFSWIGSVVTGNLGYSSTAHESVLALTGQSLPVTAELAVLSMIVAVVIGVPLGMLAASRPNRPRDWFGQGVSLAGLGIPAFLLATTLLSLCANWWGWNPNGQNYAAPWQDLGKNLQQMTLPSLVLGFGIAAPIMRTTRTAVLEIRGLDFVTTVTAKGVPRERLWFRHVLRNALLPIVTMSGLQFGYLLGGAVVVEQIFALPGIGRQVLDGINDKEFAVAQSTILVIALLFVIVNLLTDLLYRRIDPRVRAA